MTRFEFVIPTSLAAAAHRDKTRSPASFLTRLAILSVLALGADPAVAGPPSPTVASQLLARERAANGEEALGRPRMLVLHGVKHSRGLDATWRNATDLASGRTHEVADFGIFRTAAVWDGRRYWRQGRSGASHPLDSAFAQRVAETHAWLDRRGYLKSAALGARVEDLGERTADGQTFAVLRATPLHGGPVELWFYEQSWLLARAVQDLSTGVETVRYSNYRRIDQLLVPFKVVTDDNGDVETVEVDHAVIAPLDVREFQRPAPPADSSVAGGKTTVPIEVDGFVVVDAKINGAGPFAFILDTGGRAILTPSVAEQLGLTLNSAAVARGAGGGGLKTQFANLNRLEIGGAAVRDLSVAVVPLGFDTLERGAKGIPHLLHVALIQCL